MIRSTLAPALLLLCACPVAQGTADERARAALHRLAGDGFEASLPGGARVEVAPGASRWIAPSVDAGNRATLLAYGQLSTEGRMDGTPFSYLGTERIEVTCASGTCRATGPPPRLLGVLEALHARRAALARGEGEGEADAIAAAAARRPAAWFIRVDRDEATVGEADAEGVQHALGLRQRDGRWVIHSGLP